MAKLILHPGMVGDYEGAYDWVRPEDEARHPEDFTLGYHEGSTGWPEDSYTVVEIKGE